MHAPRFTGPPSLNGSNGMTERDFTVGDVPGVLRSPASGAGRAPLVLMGHGGGNHKKHPAMLGRAQRLVAGCGFHVAVIDAPGHCDRPRSAHDEREIASLYEARAAGEPVGPIVVRYNTHLARLAVPEWQATHRDRSAAGRSRAQDHGRGLRAALARRPGRHARRITVPVEFDLQWDDEHIPREAGLALFDAFASAEKTLHANAGRHKELPRFEADSAVRFFARHLGRHPGGAVTSPA